MTAQNLCQMQHCDWCGADAGYFVRAWGDIVSCGKSTCDREVRNMEEAARDERRERAEKDDFGMY